MPEQAAPSIDNPAEFERVLGLGLGRAILVGMVAALLSFIWQPIATAQSVACTGPAGWTVLSVLGSVPSGDSQPAKLPGSIAVTWEETPTIYVTGLWPGLLRSVDCGVTWASVPSPWQGVAGWGAARAVVVDRGGQLYVLLYGGLHVMSNDGGQTWESSGNVTYPGGDAVGSVPYASSMGTSPTTPGLAYATMNTRAGRGEIVTARTTDGGVTWQVIERSPIGLSIVVDPDPTILYSASPERPIFRHRISAERLTFERVADLPENVTRLAMSSDGTRFWAATESGALYRSLDRGISWRKHVNAPEVSGWRGLAVSPVASDVVYGLSNDGRFWIYHEPAEAPSQVPVLTSR